MQETSIKLSLKFTMNTSYIIWGIVSIVFSIWLAVIQITGGNTDSKDDLTYGVPLVLFLALGGIYLFVQGYKLRIVANDDEIIAKGISGEPKSILWKDISSVTLEKSPQALLSEVSIKQLLSL